jgi:S-adenosylmethionine hydrolase
VSSRSQVITLLTDFGTKDAFVGIMKGVILRINPAVTLVDLSHEVPPQDLLASALILRNAVAFFPPGTIHVAVVDPGVGSARRALLVQTAHAFFVGPDNGIVSLAAPAESVVRIIHLTNERYFLSPRSHTFHGRDVFAPTAAHLSCGVPLEELGVPVTTMERLTVPTVERHTGKLIGSVIYIDHFGNVITNISEEDLRPFSRGTLLVSIGAMHLHSVVASYAVVEIGEPAALINSWGMLEIAVRNGSAAQCCGISLGQPVYLSAT